MNTLVETSIVEKVVQNSFNFFQKNKYSLASTWLFGLLSYFFIFSNKLPNFDDIYFSFSLGTGLPLGRWGLDALSCVVPKYSMPWFHGIVSLVIISIAICRLIHIYEIKNKYIQIITSALIVTFPGQLAVFANMFTSIPYAIAFLLSTYSLSCIKRESLIYNILGCMILIVATSIYQVFLAVTASFLIVVIIQRMLTANDAKNNLLGTIAKYFISISLSCIVYIFVTGIFMKISSASFNEYAYDRFPKTLSQLFTGGIRVYNDFFLIFKEGNYGLIDTTLSRYSHFIISIIVIILSLWHLFRQGSLKKIYIFSILLLALFFCINIFDILSIYASHALTLYGFISLYFLMAIIIDNNFFSRKIYDIILISTMCIVLSNVFYANKKSFQWYLQYENYYSYMVSMVTQIKMFPDFDRNSKLAIIGGNFETTYLFEDFGRDNMARQNFPWMIDDWREQFIKYYGGFNIEMATKEEKIGLILHDDFKHMANYPYPGSIKKIGNYIVVKMHNFYAD